ncbi:MAG: peptide deformylase [Candidatus Vogelbacteria bacterium]|nr:peptide deformylase [Candidatus Vogelbacteria bacterium]
MTSIVQKDNNVLRLVAKEVPFEEIGDEKLRKTVTEMMMALDKCEDGVALAAPQIGVSLRIFVVSPKAFILQNQETKSLNKRKEIDKLIYINPVITKTSSKKVTLDEGCLSVKGIFGKIKRHSKVTISAYDELGKKFIRGASGLLAEIFQHETDHLNGILFIDTAKDLTQANEQKISDVPNK